MDNTTSAQHVISITIATDGSADRGDGEKLLAMAILGIGSILSGMAPAIISQQNRRRFPLTTSMFLCFGAGVLLATALVHIMPEVRNQMKSNMAEITVCVGFFIIYFIDEFIHYFFGEAMQHTQTHTHNSVAVGRTHNNDYGGSDNDRTPLLAANGDHHSELRQRNTSHDDSAQSEHSSVHGAEHVVIEDVNARICHTNHEEPCGQSITGTLGLFVALSLHSAIEGLAIGVQDSASKVLFLLGAVACHKFVMAFCLGLEFRSNPRASFRQHFIGILVFALGAVFGIAIGVIIVDVPSDWTGSALPIIQGIAGGTLFYVTVCEVIPREKTRWHQNPARRAAGFGQLLSVVSGFTLMCVINSYMDDDHS